MAGRVSAQQEDEVVIKEENLTSEKVIGGTDEAFSEVGSARTEIWKYLLCFEQMMRRDRWDEKGRSQDAINISGWKKGAGGIKH